MRKNKKIVAILTLLMFAMSMIVPVAASAAYVGTPTSLAANNNANDRTTPANEQLTFTATLAQDAPATENQNVYLVTPDNVAYLGDETGDATDGFTVEFPGATGLTTPAAAETAQTNVYRLVEAASPAEAIATGDNLDTITLTVEAAPAPVANVVIDPFVLEADTITVDYTDAVAGDTVKLYDPNGNQVGATHTVVNPDATDVAFAIPDPGALAGQYRAVLADAQGVEKDSAVARATNVAPEDTVAVADASYIQVIDKNVGVREASETELSIRNAAGERVDIPDEGIYVWAEDRVGQPTSALQNVKIAGVPVTTADPRVTQVGNNVWYIQNVDGQAELDDNFSIDMYYSRAGDYSVYASIGNPNTDNAGTPQYAENAAYGNVAVFKSTSRVVNVEGDKAEVVAIGVESVNSPEEDEVILFDGEVYGEDRDTTVGPILVDPNGVSKTDLDFVVYQYKDVNNNGEIDPVEVVSTNLEPVDIGIDVTFDTNSNAIKVSKDKDTTDYNGMVDVSVTGTVEGKYNVYVKAGGVEITIPVEVAPVRADDIKVTKQPTGPIASGDYSTGCDFRFQILDPNGMVISNALTGDDDSVVLGVDGLNDQLVDGPYGFDVYEGDFVNLTAPAAADMDEEDVNIERREVRDQNGNMVPTGEYCVTFDKDLVAGDYTLEIILDNGRKATFDWTVKDFGTAKELKIEYPRDTIELNGISGTPDIYFLDENGVKKDAARYVDLGASGYAIKSFNTETGVVQVENDEKYIGDTINVYAVAEREGLTAQAVLTVTSGEGHLVFDQKSGPVDFNNRVPFKVVDSEGNQLVLGADKEIMSATVVVTKQSNPDAKITGNVATYSYNDILTKGAGILNLTSDEAGTAEVKVTLVVKQDKRDGVYDAYDTQVYSGTLDYTFGDVSEYDGRIVVMVIGSADTIVDNKIVTIDAAPFVNADWRTMVPFRALAEDFGAKVEWNEADQTVTAELDGVTLVMTIGSETYTVNGVEKTMDTAPVIVDGRTYVPVRFPAEAFGFDVVPTYNDEGLTSSVLFTK